MNKGATSLLNDILEQAFIPYLAQRLIENGYGDVSEYKAEIKELTKKNEVLKDGVTKAYTNGFNDGMKQVEKDIRQAQIDVLNRVKLITQKEINKIIFKELQEK